MAHFRESRPDSGLGFQVTGIKTVHGVPSSLGSGEASRGGGEGDWSVFVNLRNGGNLKKWTWGGGGGHRDRGGKRHDTHLKFDSTRGSVSEWVSEWVSV